MSAWKGVMAEWLSKKNIPFTNAMLKPELYELIKRNKPQKVHQTDVIAEELGHLVLRTPPRQCELNAIELIWALVKKAVAARNTGKIKEVMQLTKQVLSEVTKEQWETVIRHTIDMENGYWKADGLTEEVEPIIVHIGSDESDDSDCESDDSDDEDKREQLMREWVELFGESDDDEDDFVGFVSSHIQKAVA